MKSARFVIALLVPACAAFASAALAQSRPDTRKMDCGGARKLVAARGAVVLSTSDNAYDRYVWTQASCPRGEETTPAYAPTKDFTGCHIGYTCAPPKTGRR